MSSQTKFPATVENDSTGTPWTNPENAGATDGAVANVATVGPSQRLKATDFGFDIADNATILGVDVHVVRRSASQNVKDAVVGLTLPLSESKADAVTGWPATLTNKSYGGAADLWMLAITPADVNASTFGCLLSCQPMVFTGEGEVDSLSMTVHYAIPVQPIEFELADYLLSRPAVSAIVGTRITVGRSPQTTGQNKRQARIVYKLLPGSRRHYHSQGASGLVEADIELLMIAPKYETARDLYDLVRNKIDGFRGEWGGTTIDRATLTPPADGSGDPTQGDDTGYPAIMATVEVFYQESIPALAGP